MLARRLSCLISTDGAVRRPAAVPNLDQFRPVLSVPLSHDAVVASQSSVELRAVADPVVGGFATNANPEMWRRVLARKHLNSKAVEPINKELHEAAGLRTGSAFTLIEIQGRSQLRDRAAVFHLDNPFGFDSGVSTTLH